MTVRFDERNIIDPEELWNKIQFLGATLFSQNMIGWKECETKIMANKDHFKQWAKMKTRTKEGLSCECRHCNVAIYVCWDAARTNSHEHLEPKRRELLDFFDIPRDYTQDDMRRV